MDLQNSCDSKTFSFLPIFISQISHAQIARLLSVECDMANVIRNPARNSQYLGNGISQKPEMSNAPAGRQDLLSVLPESLCNYAHFHFGVSAPLNSSSNISETPELETFKLDMHRGLVGLHSFHQICLPFRSGGAGTRKSVHSDSTPTFTPSYSHPVAS